MRLSTNALFSLIMKKKKMNKIHLGLKIVALSIIIITHIAELVYFS